MLQLKSVPIKSFVQQWSDGLYELQNIFKLVVFRQQHHFQLPETVVVTLESEKVYFLRSGVVLIVYIQRRIAYI